jgi:hypothetical protein
MKSNSSTAAQKRDELAQFRRFAAACACVPSGEWRQPSEPAPDVVVDGPAGEIGIELTELDPSGAEKRLAQREQADIIAAARRLYDAAGYPPVHVWVTWADGAFKWKKHRHRLARALYELVVEERELCESLHQVGTGFDLLRPDVPVVHLMLARASSAVASEWRDGSFHQVGACGVAELQDRIALEDAKVGRYQQAYASRWLVFVLGAAGPSTWATVLPDVWPAHFRTNYDRLFLLHLDPDWCGELGVSRTKGADNDCRAVS